MAAARRTDAQMRWQSVSATHVGLVRKVNEDCILDRPDIGVWAVADGMGGHSAGDLASQMLIESLGRLRVPADLSTFVEFAEHNILAVNDRLLDLARFRQQVIGSTIVTLLMRDRHCAFLWAGDSRLYRLRDGQFEQLTTDHSQVEQYVQQGLLSREDAQFHPDNNLITRAVGATQSLFLDCDVAAMTPGDRYLLSSDGLDKHVMARDIADGLRRFDLPRCARHLINLALENGGTDNVSVCLVEVLDE